MDTAACTLAAPEGWPAVYRALQTGSLGRGRVRGLEVSRGEECLVLELAGRIKGIVPPGEAGLWAGQRLLDLVGQPIPYRVTAVDRTGGMAVLSRRQALDALARKTWQSVAEGSELDAFVVRVGRRLAVLEAAGVTALLPFSELSHGYVADPYTILSPGRSLRVRVLRCERGAGRLIVSLRALVPDPWLAGPERYRPGGLYLGTVQRVEEQGLRVELEPGLLVRTNHHQVLQPLAGERAVVRLVACDWPRRRLRGVLAAAGPGVGT